MKAISVLAALAALSLAGCQRAADGFSAARGVHGRYIGVGHFTPGPMWSQIVQPPAKDLAKAGPADDEQVIVVMDSATGEVRQCGNLSGRCIGMNPWAQPLAPGRVAPLTVAKHADELSGKQ